MSYQMQSEQSKQKESGSGSSTSSNPSLVGASMSGGSSSTSTLKDILSMIVAGHMQESMMSAHQLAEVARKHNDTSTVQWAGKLWTIANGFSEIQQIIAQETMTGVKDKAALIGRLARSLDDSRTVSQEDVDRVLTSAGGYWQLADKDEKQSKSNGTGAAATAQNAETVEQYKMSTGRTWAHCGIATSLMLLQANGLGSMADANDLVSEMYIHEKGTDVGLMAESLRRRGLETASHTRNGKWDQLMTTLQKGQPVPFGVTHCVGDIVKMNSTPSKYFAHKRPGDRYSDEFPGSGHWILVVGFEGPAENPTHFLYNDPHLGGQVRATRDELGSMGVGDGQFFLISQ